MVQQDNHFRCPCLFVFEFWEPGIEFRRSLSFGMQYGLEKPWLNLEGVCREVKWMIRQPFIM